MQNNINFENSTDLIEANYQGQFPRQMPIWLVIDWENETIESCTRNYSIGGTPSREWHGLVSAFQLPNDVDALALHDDIENYLALINLISKGFSIEHDGSNFKGQFTEESRDHLWELERLLVDQVNISLLHEETYADACLDKEID